MVPAQQNIGQCSAYGYAEFQMLYNVMHIFKGSVYLNNSSYKLKYLITRFVISQNCAKYFRCLDLITFHLVQ